MQEAVTFMGRKLVADHLGLITIIRQDGSKSSPFPNMTRAKDAIRAACGLQGDR